MRNKLLLVQIVANITMVTLICIDKAWNIYERKRDNSRKNQSDELWFPPEPKTPK